MPSFATAQSADKDWSPAVLFRAGTLGVGAEVDVRIPRSAFGLRADIDGLAFGGGDLFSNRFNHDERAYAYHTTLRYGGTVKLLNGGLTADYYPFGTGFRLSPGIIINGNALAASAEPTGSLRIGTTSYAGQLPGRVNAGATFNAVAPVFGVGYSALLTRHVRASIDVGAVFQGNPHLSYQAGGSLAQLPSIPGDAERARRRMQHDVDYPVYPLVMLGVGWQF